MSKRTIEIESPEYLEDGLYSQPPFDTVLPQAAQKTQVDQDKLASILTSTALAHNQETPGELSAIMSTPYRLQYLELRNFFKRLKIRANERNPYYAALGLVGKNLTEYPYWDQYISVNYNFALFKADGSRTKTAPTIQTPTYANWVTGKLERIAREPLVGLEEVLPAGFPEDSLGQPPIRKDKPIGNRKWQIIRASELSQPQRR